MLNGKPAFNKKRIRSALTDAPGLHDVVGKITSPRVAPGQRGPRDDSRTDNDHREKGFHYGVLRGAAVILHGANHVQPVCMLRNGVSAFTKTRSTLRKYPVLGLFTPCSMSNTENPTSAIRPTISANSAPPLNRGRTKASAITASEFGHPINLHLFRDCLATATALEDPEHVGIIPAVLGHNDPASGERYYNQADTVSAARCYQDGILGLRREFTGRGRRPRLDRRRD